jgi:hypothetical protein
VPLIPRNHVGRLGENMPSVALPTASFSAHLNPAETAVPRRCWSPTRARVVASSRCNAGVVSISCLVFYLDRVPPDPERLRAVYWIVHTTWSHTPSTPRWLSEAACEELADQARRISGGRPATTSLRQATGRRRRPRSWPCGAMCACWMPAVLSLAHCRGVDVELVQGAVRIVTCAV